MKIPFLAIMLAFAFSTPITAQTPQDIKTTCDTLVRLTDAALQSKDLVEVHSYTKAAMYIRRCRNEENGCHKDYFEKVVQGNPSIKKLVADPKCCGNFIHRKIDKLLKLVEDGKLTRQQLGDVFKKLGIEGRVPKEKNHTETPRPQGGLTPLREN